MISDPRPSTPIGVGVFLLLMLTAVAAIVPPLAHAQPSTPGPRLRGASEPLAVDATSNLSAVALGGAIQFTAIATGGSGSYGFAWVFGDGGKASDATTSHRFTTAGTFTCVVWANDTDGVSASGRVTVTVRGSPPPNPSPSAAPGSVPSWELAILALLVALGALVVELGRRRWKGPPARAPPEAAAIATGAAPESEPDADGGGGRPTDARTSARALPPGAARRGG